MAVRIILVAEASREVSTVVYFISSDGMLKESNFKSFENDDQAPAAAAAATNAHETAIVYVLLYI
jgi:predicted regulator of Ras-like GTPase activity (Roadblock/LC7/MglB family)